MSIRQFNTVLVGDVGGKVLTALFVLAMIRVLPPADFAAYVYVNALVVLACSSLSGFVNRQYMFAESDDALARRMRWFQIGASVMFYAAVVAATARDMAPGVLAAGLFCTLAAAQFDFLRTHVQKSHDFAAWTRAEITRALTSLLLAVPAIVAFEGSARVAGIVVAQALAFAVAGTLMMRSGEVRHGGHGDTVVDALFNRRALPFALYFAIISVQGQLPILLFKPIADTQAFASLGSASRYYGLVLSLVVAANVVILPRIATGTSLKGPYQGGVKSLLLYAVLGLIAAMGLGYLLIPFVDAGKYPDAPALFLIMATGLIPGVFMAPLTSWLPKIGRSMQLLYASIAALVASFATFRLLVEHGAYAAALSLPVATAVQGLWLYVAYRDASRADEVLAR